MTRADETQLALSEGRATAAPTVWAAGEWGTLNVRFEVGARGIRLGGGIRVQLPDTWHAWFRNSAKGVQSTNPSAPHYVTARCSSSQAEIRCEVEGSTTTEFVKTNRTGLDGRVQRYVFVTRVTVTEGELRPGDLVDVVYGDRAGGSKGFTAGLHLEGPERIFIAVDPDGMDDWRLLDSGDCPSLVVTSGEMYELSVLAPSTLQVGEGAELHVACLDALGNRVGAVEGTVRLEVWQGSASVSSAVELSKDDCGVVRVPFVALSSGIVRLKVTTGALSALSNPIKVTDTAPTHRLYWGELHAHGARSFDGVGGAPFDYARDVAGLDFFALTDHAEGWPEGTWEWLKKHVSDYYQPHRFVTLLAYEATFGSPWGHHNVYFRGDSGPVVGDDTGTLLDLWEALDVGNALTIPHHTGVCFSPTTEGSIVGGQCPNPDWRHHNPEFRRLIEIYSGHGLCETYDPTHPLSYENCDFSIDSSNKGPHYARDAWDLGQQLGVIASSDNHRGTPGRSETGQAGVWAGELTREAIFDALRDRRTYGTTGARILLDFSANGVPMGLDLRSTGPCRLAIEAHGTDEIDYVELIAGDLQVPSYRVLQRWTVSALDFSTEFTDSAPPHRGLYYVRLRQRSHHRGRVVMAWSSPIWVNPGTETDSAQNLRSDTTSPSHRPTLTGSGRISDVDSAPATQSRSGGY